MQRRGIADYKGEKYFSKIIQKMAQNRKVEEFELLCITTIMMDINMLLKV
jgi:hypothetical protein